MSNVICLNDYRPKPKPLSRRTKKELLAELGRIKSRCTQLEDERDEQDELIEKYRSQLESSGTNLEVLEELEEARTELQELREQLEEAPTRDELKAAEREHEEAELYCEELEEFAIELARIAVAADRPRVLELLISYHQRIESLDLDHGLPRRLSAAFV